MPYDEVIASRIRDLLADDPTVTEKKMFGGLAFLVNGHMAVAASSAKGALVRVDPDRLDRFVETTAAVPMVMRGRRMAGWLAVPPSELVTKREPPTDLNRLPGQIRLLSPNTAWKPRIEPPPRATDCSRPAAAGQAVGSTTWNRMWSCQRRAMFRYSGANPTRSKPLRARTVCEAALSTSVCAAVPQAGSNPASAPQNGTQTPI